MCPPMRAHWRHLADWTCASFSPSEATTQRQIDQFSQFCTAHGRVSTGTLATPGEYNWPCARWRHLAIMLELVLPSSPLTSPQSTRQIDEFSHFCTAHGRKSLYFTLDIIFSLSPKLPHPMAGSKPPSYTCFLGPIQVHNPVQPLWHRWSQSVPILNNRTRLPPQNCPFPWGIWTLI